MNRAYLRKVASITGISLAALTQSLEARQLVLPPTELIEAHKPELVKPDGTPLFGPSREQVMMAMGIMPGVSMGFMAQGDTALTPASVFKVNLRTGTGSAASVSGVPFAPDLYIGKGRSGATAWGWYDTARGATFDLDSTSNSDPTTQAQGVTAFNSDGVSIGTLAKLNTNAATYVDYLFKERAGFFCRVTYTGNGASNRQIAHPLGVTPGLIIVKSYSGSAGHNWWVYHRSLTSQADALILNATAIKDTNTAFWGTTAHDASNFSVGSYSNNNQSGIDFVAYIFAHDPTGIIQCGDYSGNGTSSNVISLGWEPQFVMLKRTTVATGDWYIIDTARGFTTVFGDQKGLSPNTSAAQGDVFSLKRTATGFEVGQDAASNINASGAYIYMAIKA